MDSNRFWSKNGAEFEGIKPSNFRAHLLAAVEAAKRNSPYFFEELSGGLKELVGDLIFYGDEKNLIDATSREVIKVIDELSQEKGWKTIEDIDIEMVKARFPRRNEELNESAPRKKMFLTPPGYGGHQNDYTFNMEGYGLNNFIPDELANEVASALGDEWEVVNRGSRLEISHKTEYGKRDDTHVMDAIETAFNSKGYDLDLM